MSTGRSTGRVSSSAPGALAKKSPGVFLESVENYRTLVHNLEEIIFSLDKKGRITFVTPSIKRMIGYKPEEVIGQGFERFIHPEDLPALRKRFRKVLAGEEQPSEYRILDKRGKVHFVHSSSQLFRQAGQVVGITGVMVDITRRKMDEEQLRQSEKQYRSLFEGAPIGIGVADLKGRLKVFNDAILVPGGYSREDIEKIGNVNKLYFDRQERQKALAELRQQGELKKYPVRFKRRDGTAYRALLTLAPVSVRGEPCLQAIVEDLTEHDEAEKALQKAENEFRRIVEQLPAAVYMDALDELSSTLYFSPPIESMTGYSPAEWIGNPQMWVDILHPEDRTWVLAEHKRTNRSGERFSLEYRLIHKDGRVVWVKDESDLLKDADGLPLYWQGVMLDITDRKKAELGRSSAELRLKDHEEQFRQLIELSPEPTVIFSEGTILYTNPAMLNLLGATRADQVVGRPVNDFVHPDFRAAIAERIRPGVGLQSVLPGVREKFLHLDGSVIDVEVAAIPMKYQGRSAVQVLIHDVTEQTKAENALRENEQKYRTVVESASDGILIVKAGIVLYLNPPAARMVGRETGEIVGKPFTEYLHPKSLPAVTRDYRKRPANQKHPSPYSVTILHSNGTEIDVEVSTVVIPYEGERADLVFLRDVTERKRAALALQKVENRYRSLVENLPVVIYQEALGNPSVFTYISPKVAHLTGYSAEEWIADETLWTRLIHPNDRERVVIEDGRTDRTQEPYRMEYRMVARDGHLVWVHDEAVIVADEAGKPAYWQGYLLDITATKIAEDARWNSEASYRGLFNSVSEAIYIQDREGRFLDVNDGAVRMYGYPRENLTGKTLEQVAAPGLNDFEAVHHNLELAFQGKPQQLEFWGMRNSGEVFPTDIWLNKGSYLGEEVVISVAQDINDRKKSEKALRESEEKFRRIVEASPMGMHMYELLNDGRLVFNGANPAADRILGIRHETLIGKSMEQAFPGLKETELLAQVRRVAAEGASWQTDQIIYKDKNFAGIFQAFAFQTSPNRVVLMFQDVTGRKKAEEAIQRQLDELKVMRTIAEVGTRAAIVDDLIEQVTDIMVQTFQLDSFGVLLWEPLKEILRLHPSYHGTLKAHTSVGIPVGVGLAGYVASSRKPYRVDDTSSTPQFLGLSRGSHSGLCVPVLSGKVLIGVINAESRQKAHFGPADERLLVTISDTLATAVEKLRLFEVEYARRQGAETLQDATKALSSSLELQTVLETILHSLEEILAHDSASVLLRDEGYFRVVAARGHPRDSQFIGRTFPLDDRWKSLVESHQKIIIADAQSDPIFVKFPDSDYIHGWMAVPLVTHGEVIGCLCLDSRKPNAFSQEDAAQVQTFAHHAASVIENARLFSVEREQHHRQETMVDLMRVAASSLDPDLVIRSILKNMIQLISCESGSIQLLEGETLVTKSEFGYPEGTISAGTRFPLVEFPLNQQIVVEKVPIFIGDIQLDERYIQLPGTEAIRSVLGVPLIYKDTVIGIAMLESQLTDRFSEQDATLANAIANNAAVAIENARLFEAEHKQRLEAETLRQSAVVVASTLDQTDAIQLILDQLAQVVKYESASVQLLGEGYLEIVGGKGWSEGQSVLGIRFPVPGDNPNSVVIRTRQPQLLGDALVQYPQFLDGVHANIHSWLGVPMIVRDRVIGMLAVESSRANAFREDDARLVGAFANQAAIAIENTRLYEQAVRAAERRSVLHQASQDIAQASLDPEEVYRAVHGAAAKLMPAEAFVISFLDESQENIQSVYLVDKGGRWPSSTSPRKVGLSGHIVNSGQSLIVHDLDQNPLQQGIHFGAEQEVRSILAVPLYSGKTPVGMISAQSYKPHAYTEEDQASLEMLSAQAAVAIENARLYKQTLRRLQEMEMVNRVSTQLRIAQKTTDMLPLLLEEALQILSSGVGGIWLYDPASDTLKVGAARGWFSEIERVPFKPGEGIAGKVFVTGKPIISKEFAIDPQTREITRRQFPDGWGGACVPIRSMQDSVGVMFVSVPVPRQLGEDEIHLLVTLCEIAGNAIRRADLNEQTERQLQRMASLRAIDMAISTILDLRVTLSVLLDHIITQLKVDAVDILLLNETMQTLTHAASTGFRNDRVRQTELFIGDDLAGQAVRTRTLLYVADLAGNVHFSRTKLFAGEQFITYFGVPLIAKGQIKGILEIFNRSRLEPDPDWRNFLETMASQAAIAIDNSVLFEELQKTNLDLSLAYDATIEGWSKALDLRDHETEGHALRVSDQTLRLANRMGLSGGDIVHLRRGVLLHDIGKMGVPDSILYKEGKLDDQEWETMRHHPEFAFDMLSPINYLRQALDIPFCHHERWNGSGYPRQLTGEQIPLPARIFAVVDVWDALTSDRPYRKRWTHQAALEYIRTNSNVLFDPNVVRHFVQVLQEDGLD